MIHCLTIKETRSMSCLLGGDPSEEEEVRVAVNVVRKHDSMNEKEGKERRK